MSRSAFQEELRAYEPANDIERAHREAMMDLLAYSPDAFSRHHFVPGHFTASCFIIDAEGRLLLHHHRRLDRWLQMGGHLEPDETPQEAALREGAEESGLRDLKLRDAIFDLDVHDIPPSESDPEHAHFDVRYLARTSAPDAITIARGESNELAWFDLERAAALMPGAESQRVIGKIERLLRERSLT
jgi:8-oxo-dGTP pyrophosphatase MutT (NUDIX family)